MPIQPLPQSAIRNSRSASRRSAFTLIELLVVISIIVILLGILIPVVDNMREQAQATNTRAGIQQIAAMMQAYQGDHSAYPGPIPNTQLRGAAANGITSVPDPAVGPKITMAENVYLGLMGGLRTVTPVTAPPTFAYDPALAGQGPRSLGTVPKKFPPYGDNANITRINNSGDFSDEVADCPDSIVPEFLDRFPDPMPLLILRARTGITATATGPNAVVSANPTTPPPAQYDQTQVAPYVGQPAGVGPYIGVGKENDGDWTLPFPQHGFTSDPDPNTTLVSGAPGYVCPYNIHAALRHPTIPNTPKQKDGFIIISAGIDRVYGTKDDVTNFGQY